MGDEDVIKALKDSLKYLLQQEEIRHQEIEALNAKIDALSSQFSSKLDDWDKFSGEQRLRAFRDKYHDKLDKFNEPMSLINGSDYDAVKDSFDYYNQMEGEKPDEDEYVDKVAGSLQEYIDGIKAKLGTEAIKITADTTGNGKPDTVVVDESKTVKTAEPADDAAKAAEMGKIEEQYKNDQDKDAAVKALTGIGYSDAEASQYVENWDKELEESFNKDIESAADKLVSKENK
jgi:hypothetical protein